MTAVVLALVIAALSAALVWRLAAPVFDHPTLARRNVRGIDVPTAGGVVLVLALLPPLAVASVILRLVAEPDSVLPEMHEAFTVVAIVSVFAVLGLVDDLLAQGEDRGFRGHLGALYRGRLTTGGIKLLGGGLAAVALTATDGPLWEWVVAAGVVALATNTANLFDRAPGRVTKIAVAALVVLLVTAAPDERWLVGPAAAVVGAALGLLVAELRESVMLGDTGANPIGAVLGLAVVATTGPWTQLAVLVVLLALNLVSERISFSAVIDRTPALRWLDQLGRRPMT
ncbi:hypothetical protein [Actinomarinicola tropica]|uniref:Glycosyl transferase family 4 n=1 Tax=Actinomarinicola tropica TaxID=2789776 RepID=A0A5Q2RLB9_9ACTN|nr:hypothetical protein [Actinomarinicola tropica]QGG95226.1 hypothetical protein GH723_09045 [Actinomarinicola tropica]